VSEICVLLKDQSANSSNKQ